MNENMRGFIWRIDLIEQAADEIFKKSKLIEEDTCVVCYSEKPSDSCSNNIMKKFFDYPKSNKKSDKKSDKSKKKKIPDEEVNQIKILTEENNVLKTENADQKEQIKKLQIDSDSKDKIIGDLFLTVIYKQLNDMKKVNLDFVTEILENIKKLQVSSASKDKIIADFFFTVIDKQLKGMNEVKLDYVTEILENIKKQEVNSASIDKIVADLFFKVIDKQLEAGQEVELDYVTKIIENMAETDRENSLNRKDNNVDTFLHRLIRSSNINDTISIEEFTDRYQESYH